jgi:hypothetical protein
MDPMAEFHKFVLPVFLAKHLSDKSWEDFFDANPDAPVAPSEPVSASVEEDWFHMDQEVDDLGRPVDVDGEDFMCGNAQNNVNKSRKHKGVLLTTVAKKDLVFVLAPSKDDPYPDKIWAVKVLKVNPNPEDPRLFIKGHKWHFQGKWFQATDWRDCRSAFVPCTIAKWQQTTIYDQMLEYAPDFDPDAVPEPSNLPSNSKRHVQWLQFFDRTKWNSRELMANVKIPENHKERGKFRFPERTLLQLHVNFPQLEIVNTLPRQGFNADGEKTSDGSGSRDEAMDEEG